MNKRNRLGRALLFCILFSAAGLQAKSYDAPDFNGDGLSDLGQVWSDHGQLSVSVLLSDKKKFAESKWTDLKGNYDQTQRWFYGDFNGDKKSDTACLWNDAGKMSCTVYLSSGSKKFATFTNSVWTVKSGAFAYADKWFTGDFNGDQKTDLARTYNENGKRSIEVYLSNGTGFAAPKKWVDQKGAFSADDVWLTGNFDGAPGTDFAVVAAGAKVTISMYLSSGTSFKNTNWVTETGTRLASMKWVAEDFNGDGKTDIASLWNDNGAVSINAYRATGDSFATETWAVKNGKFEREHRWLVGDFNGDGKVDVARLWNDGGKLSIESYESNGHAFTPRMLLKQGCMYRDQDVFTVGDFNGDSSSDIAITWADEKNWHSDVVLSTGGTSTIKSFSTLPLSDYFDRHPLVNPVKGDTFTDYAKLSGAVPVGADLQSVLDGGNDLLLVKGKIYDASHTINYQASYQTIKTMDALFISDYAAIRQQIDQGDFDTVISGNTQDYLHLENVTIDGNKYKLGQKGKLQNQGQGAMVFFSYTEGVWIRRCVFCNARTWSTCHLVESGNSHSHIVEYNYVLGAGDDPRGCGRYVDASGYGAAGKVSIGWCDGFSISASKVTARYNFIMDCTDVGLVLFGAPGSHVYDNIILNYSRDNHGGINMVDDTENRYMGMDSTFGKEYKCYDYRGNVVENNRIVASGCRIQIGIPMGNRIWKRVKPAVFDMDGGVVRNNILEGDAFGYGYVLDYVKNVNFYGNKSIATHSGKGRGTSDNGENPDPATAFLYDPAHVRVATNGVLQDGFTKNTKVIEHFLFHNGTPVAGDGYRYYPYTAIEAEAMVKAAYLEMLGRQPTAQELTAGKNSFLIDPKPETPINEAEKQYGDAFRRELMKRPEFVEKFGVVTTQNLHPFRIARWRDRINANDVAAILKTGNYADPKNVYDLVLADLAYVPTKANADITSVSPSLPAVLAQGVTIDLAVTVKNTGTVAWENTANNPKKFALASVGDDTTFGVTRAYIPDGTSVKPGQSYTFHLAVSAPPVAWAGKGNPTATPFPYDLKMMQESVGYFGKTLTDHLGSKPQIAVENVKEPAPQPVYNSTFISQQIQGDPQINGIQPGAKMAVDLTFKNSGNYTSDAWTKDGHFTLGSENPKDNRTWGSNRIPLDDLQVVPFGETVTFHDVLTAPDTEGEYNFQWKMLGAGWFGQKSDNLVIKVSKSAPAIVLTDSKFVSIDAPGKVRPGGSFTAKVTFKNTGTTPWTPETFCKLGNVASFMDRTDEHNAGITSQYTDSIDGEEDFRLFDNNTATKYFTHHASSWVQHQFANGKRYKAVKYAVTSAPDAGPGPELTTNGSFESGDTGWKLNKSSITTNSSVSGNSCLMLRQLTAANVGNTTQTITGLKTNTDYALSIWLKQEPDTQGSFTFDTDDIFDKTCQWVKDGGQPVVWTRYRGVFNTAVVDAGKKSNPTSITLRIRANSLLGTVYLDDISLVELSGGGALGDPQSWTLEGSNDGKKWTAVDTRSGVEFPKRSQRMEFDVSTPGEYEYYRFTAKSEGGNTLQFGELELLTKAAETIPADSLAPDRPVLPGESYTFALKLTAPATPGSYSLQTRMQKADYWFGQVAPNQVITVTNTPDQARLIK